MTFYIKSIGGIKIIKKKKIVHLITGLGNGGAENMLYKLLKYSDKKKYYHEVISLDDLGVYGKKIKELNIKVHVLKLNKRNALNSLKRTKVICEDFDIVDTWLYHSDLVGFIISKILLNKKLIWNIRHSNLEKDTNRKTILYLIKINSYLSKKVDCITYNSNKAMMNHRYKGYSGMREIVLPNGFEIDKFTFNYNDRVIYRNKLEIKDTEKVIITVGRWNIQKDYSTLFKSLSILNKKNVNYKMIMVGDYLNKSNSDLLYLAKKYNIQDRLILLGTRNDIPSLLSASDIYVSSSQGESFSNAIGEAMASGLEIVSTDAGDSKKIIGDTGYITDIKDYKDIANKIYNLIVTSNNYRNEGAAKRLNENYEIKYVVNIFEENYNKLLD